jgi:hypothetical protein
MHPKEHARGTCDRPTKACLVDQVVKFALAQIDEYTVFDGLPARIGADHFSRERVCRKMTGGNCLCGVECCFILFSDICPLRGAMWLGTLGSCGC